MTEINHSIVYIALASASAHETHFKMALNQLEKLLYGLECSAVFVSACVNGSGQIFYNMAVRGTTSLLPGALVSELKQIENQCGRTPPPGPVNIDLDLLLYEGLAGIFDAVLLPRPEILKYKHVAIPLSMLTGDMLYPGDTRTIAEIATAINDHCVMPLASILHSEKTFMPLWLMHK